MYHIFLGVYPNDTETVNVAKLLAEKYPNVHVIINDLPGPTCKAQNINCVIRNIKKYETLHNKRFQSLTIHDSEDVVHPYELKVTNYLIDKYPALQFPVFPIMKMPKFSNYFESITTGTYADEFAENHFITMVGRYSSGAFVPSAGTGFALSRATLDSFGDEDVLPDKSLTEDYRLSLTLYEKGIQMYYVLERVPRIVKDHKLKWEFIATRSLFPKTFKTAVKQKTRWILGITMQSLRFREIFKTKDLTFVGRYSLYKDVKAKVGNLLSIIAYPIFIYFIFSLFIPLIPIFPAKSLSYYLSIVLTIMMIERQLFRGVAVYQVYGFRSVFFSCLLPPLMPLRLIWGNIINFVATVRAFKQNYFGQKIKKNKKEQKQSKNTEKKMAWAKTDHQFLEEHVLKTYRRNIGDILLEKSYIDPELLKSALKEAQKNNQLIGNYLIKNNIISEEELLTALAKVKHIPFLEVDELESYNLEQFAKTFDKDLLTELLSIPLLKTPKGYVVAFCDSSPNNAQTILREKYNIFVNAVFVSQSAITKGLEMIYSKNNKITPEYKQSFAMRLFLGGFINHEQLILVRSYTYKNNKSEEEMMYEMGLTPQAPLNKI